MSDDLGGIIRSARRPPDWRAPGPPPRGAAGEEDLAPAAGEDLCYLSGDWRIFQRVDGHRWSLDDLVTAWVAAEAVEGRAVQSVLDLGCGIGSVMLMIAWRLAQNENRDAKILGIEAQPLSAALARRSVRFNGAPCEVLDGDLRDPDVFPEDAAFDLITGTPPYFDPDAGLMSPQIQAGPCRFETRGGIEGYCTTAGRLLAENGRFVVCEKAGDDDRVFLAAAAAELCVLTLWEVIPKAKKDALFSVYVMARLGEGKLRPMSTLTVRDEDDARTEEFIQVRDAMGMPP